MPVHIYTEPNGDDGQLVVVHETGGDSIGYKFSVTQDDGSKTASLRNIIGAQQDTDVPEAVTEALEARGYTVETDPARTDGGQPDDSLQECVQTLREALEAAKDATPPGREEHIKTALGEVMFLAAREDLRAGELNEILTSAAAASEEEVPYFLNRASDKLEALEEDIQQQSVSPPEPPVFDVEESPASEGALAQIATARDTLDAIAHADIEDGVSSRLINALEELDSILLDAGGTELLDAPARDRESADSPEDEPVRGPQETPESVIKQRHDDADLDETVPITIELTPPIVELIDFVRDADEGETTTNWIKNTIRVALVRRDHEFWSSVTAPVEVELPYEAARWAQLWANHDAATGSDRHDIETHLMDYVNLDFDWKTEGGEELDLPGGDEGGDDGGE